MQRRVEVYEQGRIQIDEANIDGKFVKLFNSGSKVSNSHGCLSTDNAHQVPGRRNRNLLTINLVSETGMSLRNLAGSLLTN